MHMFTCLCGLGAPVIKGLALVVDSSNGLKTLQF